jgi:hypothetical protein
MMRTGTIGKDAPLVLLVLGALASSAGACVGGHAAGGEHGASDMSLGTVGLALRLSAGITINKVSYAISGPAAFNKTGDISVDDSTTVSAFFTLPVGTGYTIALTAGSTDGSRQCVGQATFDITASATKQVSVGLECAATPRTGGLLVNGTVNLCPTIDALTVSPIEPTVGGSVALAATASDADGKPSVLSYAWKVTAGMVASPSAANTTFTCTTAGTSTLTLTVSDGDCTQSAPVQVTCTDAGADAGVVSAEGPAGGVCLPGSIAACYDGPAGTAGVGICLAGTRTCNGQGTAFGPCAGQVTPQTESCATPKDDNCDGQINEGCGSALMSRAWGGTRNDEGLTVTTDASSNVIVGGFVNGTVDLGCGPTTSTGTSDAMLIAKLGPTGACVWARAFGGGTAHATGLATDAAGDVYVVGTFSGTVDLGCGPLVAAGPSDVLLAQLSPAGACQWARGFGNANAQGTPRITIDGAGNIYGVGTFAGSVNFGTATLTSAGGTDIFVFKLTGAGGPIWSLRFGDAANQAGLGIGHDAANDVVISGSFNGSVNFGGANLTSAGLGDAFVAKLSPTGAHLWSKSFGDAADQSARGLALDPAGNVFAIGDAAGTIDLGGGPLPSAGGTDAWLAKLDPNGAFLWSRSFGGANNQTGVDVAADKNGSVAFISGLTGSASYGGPTLVSAGASDVVVGRLDAGGSYLWSQRFGDPASQVPAAIALDMAGNALVTGLLTGPTDFGSGGVIGGGGEDTFLVKLSP